MSLGPHENLIHSLSEVMGHDQRCVCWGVGGCRVSLEDVGRGCYRTGK